MYCSKHRLSSTLPFCLKCLVESHVTYSTNSNEDTYVYIEMGQAYGQKPSLEPKKQFNKAIDRAKTIADLL